MEYAVGNMRWECAAAFPAGASTLRHCWHGIIDSDGKCIPKSFKHAYILGPVLLCSKMYWRHINVEKEEYNKKCYLQITFYFGRNLDFLGGYCDGINLIINVTSLCNCYWHYIFYLPTLETRYSIHYFQKVFLSIQTLNWHCI